MSNKKIIIFSLILGGILVVFGVWFGKNAANKKAPAGKTLQAPAAVLGDEKAPLVLEEYTNFLCPACASFAKNTLPQIEDQYIKTGKIRMAFYVTPPYELGRAAFCASAQGKFIELHDYLFSHQQEIKQESDILAVADAIGLDKNAFNICYNSDEAKNAADAWFKQGSDKGLTVTPTFFIGSEKIEGARSFEEFKALIDAKLK